MDLRFTPEEIAFRDEVRAFISATSAAGDAPECRRPPPRQGRHRRLAAHPATRRAGRCRTGRRNGAAPAGRRCSTTSSRTRCSMAPAPEPLAFNVTMVGPVIATSATRSRRSASCRASPISTTGGARASPSPAPGSDLASLQDRGGARGRPLRRQRPEDLDHAGAIRRLDLLPGAHRSRRRRSRKAFPSC